MFTPTFLALIPWDRSNPVMHDICSQFHKGYWTDVINAHNDPHAVGWRYDENDSLELRRVELATETWRRSRRKPAVQGGLPQAVVWRVKKWLWCLQQDYLETSTAKVECQSDFVAFFDRRVNNLRLLVLLNNSLYLSTNASKSSCEWLWLFCDSVRLIKWDKSEIYGKMTKKKMMWLLWKRLHSD